MKVLCQLEEPEFILTVKNRKQIKYILHRYGLTFIYHDGSLSLEGYPGYKVNQSINGCPWSNIPTFRCLVLEKHEKCDPMQHRYKILIPNL